MANSSPVISSIVFDKTSYAPGDVMTAVVTYDDPDRKTGTVEFTVNDSTDGVGKGTGTYQIDPLKPMTYTDSLGKTWTKTGDTGKIATWTATA